ncbi:hypothetical protein GQ457_01G012350 [Hibiscus cannabinus]
MPELINLGRSKKQQIRKSSGQKNNYLPRYMSRPKESIQKGSRFNQNILLSIPVQRACPEEAEKITKRNAKPMRIKFTWSTRIGNKRVSAAKKMQQSFALPAEISAWAGPVEVETSIVDPDAITV